MRQTPRKLCLMLAFGTAATLASAQQADPMTMGPGGGPLHPQPVDTTLARIQADVARASAVPPLKISYGKKSQEWSAEKIAGLPHETLQVTPDRTGAAQTYSGIPLMALLVEIGVPQKPKGSDFRLYIVAEGRDGNKAVYSLGEVSPDVHDGSVLLADSLDGKPLTEGGPIELICSGEKRTARWIRDVVSIKVAKAD